MIICRGIRRKKGEGEALKTVPCVCRMNADGSEHRRHERGFATIFVFAAWTTCVCLSALTLMFFVQVTMEFGLDKRAQTLQGLAFPLQEEAKRALQQLKQRRINYIQLVK